MRAVVVSQCGLGDAFIAMVLAENLRKGGWDVEVLHEGLGELEGWFGCSVRRYPEGVEDVLAADRIFVFYSEDYAFVRDVLRRGKEESPEKVCVIYPYATRRVKQARYYDDFRVDPRVSLVENLVGYCRDELGISDAGVGNGVVAPEGIEKNDDVIFHVKSSNVNKDWPGKRFAEVAKGVKERGFRPVFVVGKPEEREGWKWIEEMGFSLPEFGSLDEVARAIAGARALIGVDSGFGHLASSVGVPTVTVARHPNQIRFWRPVWAPGKVITPSPLVPNLKGIRLRDQYWKSLISPRKVLKAFDTLIV